MAGAPPGPGASDVASDGVGGINPALLAAGLGNVGSGALSSRACNNCGASAAAHWKFCDQCGGALAPAADSAKTPWRDFIVEEVPAPPVNLRPGAAVGPGREGSKSRGC